MRSNLAVAIATLLVGAPLWALAWRPMLQQAAAEGDAGDHARRSVLRKAYLYLILFASVIGVMASLGNVLYLLLRAALGDPPANLILDTAQIFKFTILFVLVLAYHWQALRTDARLAARSLARRHALFPVLVLTPENGDFATSMAEALQRESSALPVALHPYAQGAPDETLSAARAVILPAELAVKPPEAIRLWLQNFSGTRLVVPTPSPGWHWLFGSGRTLRSLARQAAQTARRLAEGQEPPLPRDASPWMIVIYIFAGLAGLQLIMLILSLVISMTQGFD